MMGLPSGTRIWLATGATDMRKGFDGLAGLVQTVLGEDPFNGHLFVFRGRRGPLAKVLWWSGDGYCLSQATIAATLWPEHHCRDCGAERGAAVDASGGDRWRRPERTWRPEKPG